ncbi:MAG: ExbD/TolR family protein [Gammaproteobacteria bacterium]
MRLGRERREDDPINLTPLIDVVFLLLIFFMVSTTFDHETAIEVELPASEVESDAPRNEVLDVLISAESVVIIAETRLEEIDTESLVRALERAAAGATDIPVVIRTDARTPMQSTISVMDAAARLGLTRISLVTRRQAADVDGNDASPGSGQ